MTRLEVLNNMLRDKKLGLPIHRSVVGRSGDNLKWLRKALSGNAAATPEMLRYVNMEITDLLKTDAA